MHEDWESISLSIFQHILNALGFAWDAGQLRCALHNTMHRTVGNARQQAQSRTGEGVFPTLKACLQDVLPPTKPGSQASPTVPPTGENQSTYMSLGNFHTPPPPQLSVSSGVPHPSSQSGDIVHPSDVLRSQYNLEGILPLYPCRFQSYLLHSNKIHSHSAWEMAVPENQTTNLFVSAHQPDELFTHYTNTEGILVWNILFVHETLKRV